MNHDASLKHTACDRAIFKKMMLLLSLSLFSLITLYILVLAPLYVRFSSDVLYMGTVLPEIFSILLSAIDILVFGIFYGVLLYGIYRFSLKISLPILYLYVGAVLYKNVGNLLMTYITDGFSSEILTDLLNILIYILLELIQTAVIVLIPTLLLRRAKEQEEVRKNAAADAKKPYVPVYEYFPFSRLLNFKNPIQKSAFWMAFVPMIVHVLQRAYYDVFYTIVEGFYGNPLVDILWMLLYYTIDIVAYGIIVYFIEILLLQHLHRTDEQKKAISAENSDDLILGN